MTNEESAHTRINSHEAVCVVRHAAIEARLRRIEGILIASAGAIILMLGSIVAKLS